MGRRETLMSQLRGEPPPADDGRNVDSLLGLLEGEGAAQQVDRLAEEHPHPPPSELHDSTSDLETYYGLPLLKEHVWKAAIPAYFYVGGVAGASAALGAAATWSGSPLLGGLVRKTRLIAAGGAMVSAAFLIEDLGRPSRFFNMLRVFRPTSPMSIGSWLLAGFGALSTAAALFRGRRAGPLAAIGDGAAAGAGALGEPRALPGAARLAALAPCVRVARHRRVARAPFRNAPGRQDVRARSARGLRAAARRCARRRGGARGGSRASRPGGRPGCRLRSAS